jgi:hypothetical protein
MVTWEVAMPDAPELIDRRLFAAAAAAAVGGAMLPTQLSAQEGGDTLKSELLMDVIFDVAAPHNLGARLIVPVTGGTFTGPKLKGTVFSGGGDAIARRPDGASLLSVRATLKTDDDQLIYMFDEIDRVGGIEEQVRGPRPGTPGKGVQVSARLLSLDDLQGVEVLRLRQKQHLEVPLIRSVQGRPVLAVKHACHLRRSDARDYEAVVS